MTVEHEEMACEEALSMLGTLLLYHCSEVALHSQRVSRLAHILAHQLCLSSEESAFVALAGQFHDIGKLCIPPNILHKQSPLNTREWAIMRTHARRGSEMLLHVGGIGNQLAPLVVAHHECWDGGGYPDGVRGNDIPRGARLLSVADACDAMLSARPYQKPREDWEFRREFQHGAGSQFDPEMCDLVLHLLEQEPEVFSFSIARKTEGHDSCINITPNCSLLEAFLMNIS